jgi:N-acetylglucosaminyldiphosphoundecaprenol N-acetyl-beta-D-mannosaminyltransferase
MTEYANVLGVGVSAVNIEAAIRACDRLIGSNGRGYVSVTGVHGIMEAQVDPTFRAILNRSFLCVPDGMPTVWVGRLQGQRDIRRVYGPDFMLEFCRQSVARKHRHFLYGGKDGVAQQLADELCRRFPGLQVVGTYTPPFRPLTAEEERDLAAQIEACKPDVIWVGLSTPKQERFMAQYLGRLDAKLMVGVGAAFDVHTGRLVDAPDWVKAAGLQWLHRLLQEPRRLWKRYLINNPKFLLNIGLQFAGIKRYSLSVPIGLSPRAPDQV